MISIQITKNIAFTLITGWLGFTLNCTMTHPTVALDNSNKQQTISFNHPSTRQENIAQKRPATEIIEKKRFVDLAQLDKDQGQKVAMRIQKRSEVIMPGDQLEITLYEKLPVSQEKRIEMKRIDDEGAIFIFPLGNLNIAGMTLSQARDMIEKKMERFIITPYCEITVIKKEYEPHVLVFGEAMKLGSFPLKAGDRLLDVLSLSGGTTQNAYTSSIKLVRLYGDSIGVMTIDLNSIVKHGHIENNLIMHDQDIVYIPKSLLSGITELLTKLGSVLPWYYFVKNF